MLTAPAALAQDAVRIDAGGAHTCVLFDDGKVRCWGHGESGQLGYGNTTDIGETESPGASGPVDLGNGPATEITAGELHTCALLANGTVRCWGAEARGSSATATTAPSATTRLRRLRAPSISAQDELRLRSAPAVRTPAPVLDNGDIRCWGSSANGQPRAREHGPHRRQRERPARSPPWISVSTAPRWTCPPAMKHLRNPRQRQRAICWGSDDARQLGYPGFHGRTSGTTKCRGPSDQSTSALNDEVTSIASGFAPHLRGPRGRRFGSLLGEERRRAPRRPGTTAVDDPCGRGAGRPGCGPATDVDTGHGHGCRSRAGTLAQGSPTGTSECWGWDQNGQLGSAIQPEIGADFVTPPPPDPSPSARVARSPGSPPGGNTTAPCSTTSVTCFAGASAGRATGLRRHGQRRRRRDAGAGGSGYRAGRRDRRPAGCRQ